MSLKTQTWALMLERARWEEQKPIDDAKPLNDEELSLTSAVSPAALVRHQRGQELYGGGEPLPGEHAAQAWLRQGERVR